MKILVVQEADWLHEGPHQQHQLMDRLSVRSHEIRVIDYEIRWEKSKKRGLFSRRLVFDNAFKVLEESRVSLIRPGVVKIPLFIYFSLILSHKREIDRQIQEFKPDIIIGFGILNTYLAIRAARRVGIPFVYYWLDVLHTLIPLKPAQLLGKMIESRILKNADRVIVINKRLKDYVIGIGARPERTCVIGAGIDFKQFDPETDGNTIREKYGLNKDDIVLFFMGLLYHFSGLKEVALQIAETQDHNIKLLLVGEGEACEELRRIREDHNLQDRVILTGRKPYQEIPAFIAASDVCLLPAYDNRIMRDIVPIKIYEYMAMKKPVIATRLPGIVKEFGDDNGIIYVNKPENVVAKALELIRNGDYKELGARARSFVEKYSWDTITDEFERTLEEIIEKKQNE